MFPKLDLEKTLKEKRTVLYPIPEPLGNRNEPPNSIRVVPNDIDVVKSDMRVVPNDIDVVKSDMRVVPSSIDVVKSDMYVVPNDIDVVKSDMRVAPSSMHAAKRVANDSQSLNTLS